MKNRILYIILIGCLLASPVYMHGQVVARASIDRDKILIGEPIKLTFEVRIPMGETLTWFNLDSIPRFEIIEKGKASYYADKFEGRKTASGTTFHQNKLTAAHRTLPFGTRVKVKNLNNGKTVKVTINDRGPFVQGRTIDLSKKAARKIGILQQGVAQVQIKYRNKKA